MKKLFILLIVSLCTVSAFAQTEKGNFRVGGASDLSFLNATTNGAGESQKIFKLSLDGGYFLIDNLALNAALSYGYNNYGYTKISTIGVGLGLRYYLPVKIFFGAGFDLINTNTKITMTGFDESNSATGTGLNLEAGYAWFLSKRVAIEPSVGYRFGLSDKDQGSKMDVFSAQIGISVYF